MENQRSPENQPESRRTERRADPSGRPDPRHDSRRAEPRPDRKNRSENGHPRHSDTEASAQGGTWAGAPHETLVAPTARPPGKPFVTYPVTPSPLRTSSADPDDLERYVRDCRPADEALKTKQLRLLSDFDEFSRGTQWGSLDARTMLEQFGTYISYNVEDADTVAKIAEQFRQAGGGSGVTSLPDAAIRASLRAAGLGGRREDITVDTADAYGMPPTSGYADDPVNTSSGNFIEVEADLGFAGLVADLTWTRTYNSRSDAVGPFGRGWASWASARLRARPDGAEYEGPDGQRVVVPRLGLRYGRVAGLSGLVETTETGLEIAWFGGARWQFDDAGLPVTISRGPGTSVRLRHDGGRLVEMAHATGKSLTFEWSDDRIVGATSSDGRTVEYRYDEDGNLASVEGPAGTRTYRMRDGRIAAVVDSDGVVEVANTYDEQGRVLEQVSPFGRTTRYSYLQGRVAVTDDDTGTAPNTWIHDLAGHLVGVIDAHGERLSKSYDAWGNPVIVTERSGATTVFEWDERSRLTRRVLPTGAWFEFQYDGDDRVLAVSASTGATTRYAYDGDERHPAEIIDAEGGVTRLTVVAGVIERLVDPDGVELRFGYDPDGNLISSTDADGNVATIERDRSGQVLAASTPSGRRTEFRYDERGRAVERRDPGGGVWRFAYTPGGRLTQVADPTGAVQTIEYGDHGHIERSIDPLGRATSRRYDIFGNVAGISAPDGAKWEMQYDGLSRLTAVSDPAGATWLREYDVNGNLVGTVDPIGTHYTASTDQMGRVTRLDDGLTSAAFTFDTLGRTLTHVRPDGTQMSAEYDLCGRRTVVTSPSGGVTRFSYTPAGRLRRVVLPSGRTESYEYDRCGRPALRTDGAGRTWRLQYNADGAVTAQVAPGGESQRFAYDDAGRLISWRVPGRGTTEYEYDAVHRVTAITDRWSGRRRFAYDPVGQVVQATDANGGVTAFAYDDRGRLIRLVDPLGGESTREYDEVGRLLAKTDPLGRSTTFTYDPAGRVTERADGAGVRLRWSYDGSGRVQEFGAAGGSATTISRDLLGRPVAITEPGTYTHWMDWDASGRLVSRTRNGTGLEWSYDADGNRSALRYPDGTELTYERDDSGRISAFHHPATGAVTLGRDPSGRLTDVAADSWRAQWHYDDGELARYEVSAGMLQRVTDILRDDLGRANAVATDGSTTEYTYEEAGQLTGVVGLSGTASYTYDANGRLTGESLDGTDIEYDYDAAGQLLARRSPSGTTQYSYDGAGRRIVARSDDESSEYSWDVQGRLTGISVTRGNDERRVSLGVDALGELADVDGTAVTWDTADPMGALCAVGDTTVIGVGTPWAVRRPDSTWADWLSPDWRDSAGTGGDAWGAGTVGTPLAPGVNLGFRGELEIEGLSWLRDRPYDPSTRAFLAPDALPSVPGTAWAANLYHYGGNNPIGFADPLGRKPISDDELTAIREQMGQNAIQRGASWIDEHKELIAAGAMGAAGVVVMCTGVGGPVGAAMVGGALLTAGASAGIQKVTTGEVNWGKVAVDGALGAVAGGVFAGAGVLASTGVSTARVMGIGASAGGAFSGLAYLATEEDPTLRGTLAASAGGAVGGAVSVFGGPTAATLLGETRQALWATMTVDALGGSLEVLTSKALAGEQVTLSDMLVGVTVAPIAGRAGDMAGAWTGSSANLTQIFNGLNDSQVTRIGAAEAVGGFVQFELQVLEDKLGTR